MATSTIERARPRTTHKPAMTTASRLDHPRVALIVDHPLRDLAALVLVALRLCQHGVTCYLVPNNLRQFELWRLLPDFVLENYFHSHRKAVYREMVRYGMKIGVLDTEGGFYSDSDRFLKLFVEDPDLRSQVSCYCCWGTKFADELQRRNLFHREQIAVTGCPRLDFYTGGWRDFTLHQSPHADPYSENLVLINSVFAAANPGHYSREEAVQTLQNVAQVTREQALQRQADEDEGLRQLTGLANRLARRFPESTIVYRPHPFEGLDVYKNLLDRLPNLHCIKQGTVDGWILRATAVIQRGCSTSFESGMAGVPTLAPGWISIPWPHDLFDHASFVCDCERDLTDRLEQLFRRQHDRKPAIPPGAEELIHHWYYRVDGDSYQRVAETILRHLPGTGNRLSFTEKATKRARQWYGHSRRWLREAETRVREVTGSRKSTPDSHAATVDAWDDSLKRFTVDEVQLLIERIQKCPQAEEDGLCRDVIVKRAERAQAYRCGRGQGRTVVVAPS